MQIENQVHEAFENFSKWETYGLVFYLMDKRKITLRKIIQIARQHGISQGVIKMRRRDYLAHTAMRALRSSNFKSARVAA